MLESETPSLIQGGEARESEQAAGFQFSVTWSFLFTVPILPKSDPVLVPFSDRVRTITEPAEAPAASEAPEPAIPNLYPTTPALHLRVGAVPRLFVAGAILAALAIPVWRHSHPRQAKPKSADLEMDQRGGGWLREVASSADAGGQQARQLNIYQPSLNAADGQLEFTWKPDAQGVGWLFRAKDIGNYYAARIKVVSPAPALRLSVEHFTVYLGSEGAHSEKVLSLPRDVPFLRIRMDVAGPSFTLYLDGNAADYWTDARLANGGFGFFEDWHQASDVRSVRMSLSQTRAQLDRYSAKRTGRRGVLAIANKHGRDVPLCAFNLPLASGGA